MPANVHLLRGNASKLPRDRLTEWTHVPVEIPAPPTHLSKDARQEWKRIGVELAKLGLVAKIDRAALAVYCQAFGRWVHAERTLRKLGDKGLVETTPSGYKQMGVWLQISNRAVEQMGQYLAHFGMSPSSRMRVQLNPQADLFGDGTDDDSSTAGVSPAAAYFTDH